MSIYAERLVFLMTALCRKKGERSVSSERYLAFAFFKFAGA